MNAKLINLTGKRFGRLSVIKRSNVYVGESNTQKGQYLWECLCDCGKKFLTRSGELRYGKAISCGCYNIEKNFKHGHGTRKNGKSSTYRSWQNMFGKCFNKKLLSYKYYGARGITVCDRWSNFENFLNDMGERPEGMTLGRIHNDGNYEPSNCRWETYSQQNRNKRHGPPKNKLSELPTNIIKTSNGKLRAEVTINKIRYYLGRFNTVNEAKEVVKKKLDEFDKKHLYKEK